jgi:hypothetical protein
MPEYALITGASSGIGLELARIHAQHGHNLVLSARNEQALNELKTELENQYKVKVKVFVADLGKTENCKKLYDSLKTEEIEISFLINNAGFGNYGLFQNTDASVDLAMIDLNIQALTYLTHLFLPDMITRRKGRILNVASTAGFLPGPLMATYYATKNYVVALSLALSNELKGTDVTVTTLCPGPTSTNFAKAAQITASNLFNARIPTAFEVAHYGFNAMMKGKQLAIHGFKNRIMVWLTRFAPRWFVAKMVRSVQEIK